MDSTDNLNTQIFERSSDSFAEPSNESGSIIMYSIIFLGVLVLVAHYAGVNVFGYLGKGVDYIGDIVFPIWEKILGYFGQAALDDTKRVVNTSAKGTEAVADAVKATAEKVDDATASEEESDDEGSEDVAPSDSTTTKGSSSKKAMGSQDYAASAAAVDGDDTINGESTALEKRVGASTLRNAHRQLTADPERVGCASRGFLQTKRHIYGFVQAECYGKQEWLVLHRQLLGIQELQSRRESHRVYVRRHFPVTRRVREPQPARLIVYADYSNLYPVGNLSPLLVITRRWRG